MNWTAVVPLKRGQERKTRLASALSLAAREALSDRMAAHVLSVLATTPGIVRVVCLSPRPFETLAVSWRADEGRGLNEELAAFRAAYPAEPLVIVHGDLPLLRAEDVAALLAAARTRGAAIAPDRFDQGTNALALTPDATGLFAFGAGSFSAHRASIAPSPATMVREGLACDVDTPEDLDLAIRRGADLGSALVA